MYVKIKSLAKNSASSNSKRHVRFCFSIETAQRTDTWMTTFCVCVVMATKHQMAKSRDDTEENAVMGLPVQRGTNALWKAMTSSLQQERAKQHHSSFVLFHRMRWRHIGSPSAQSLVSLVTLHTRTEYIHSTNSQPHFRLVLAAIHVAVYVAVDSCTCGCRQHYMLL